MPRDSTNGANARRLAPCPPRLKEILDALAAVKGIELANLSYLQKESPETIRRDVVDYLSQLPGQFVRTVVAGDPAYREFREADLPDAQLERVKKNSGSPFDQWSNEDLRGFLSHAFRTLPHLAAFALGEYEFLRRSAEVLAELGQVARECVKNDDQAQTIALLPAKVNINADGIADVHSSRLSNAIDGVNLARVRQCRICGALFWAGRSDKEFDSESCGNRLRKSRLPKYADTKRAYREHKRKQAKAGTKR
jgi:hypothetical protein